MSKTKGHNGRGRALRRWNKRAKEYILIEGEGLNKEGGSVWMGRGGL